MNTNIVTPGSVPAERRMVGTLDPRTMSDGALNRADADNPRGNMPLTGAPGGRDALSQMEGPYSAPIGCVAPFSSGAVPTEHANSTSFTEQKFGEATRGEMANGPNGGGEIESGTGSGDEEMEESPGAELTSLTRPSY